MGHKGEPYLYGSVLHLYENFLIFFKLKIYINLIYLYNYFLCGDNDSTNLVPKFINLMNIFFPIHSGYSYKPTKSYPFNYKRSADFPLPKVRLFIIKKCNLKMTIMPSLRCNHGAANLDSFGTPKKLKVPVNRPT